MIRRVAHRQHPRRQVGKPIGQQEVLVKIVFNPGLAGQVVGRAGGKETVAQPAGPFARRAVHEQVERVLAERFNARRIEPIQTLVAAGKMRLPGLGVGVLAEMEIGDRAVALRTDYFDIPHRVGLHRFDLVAARLQLVGNRIDTTQTLEIDIAGGKNFIEREPEPRLPRAGDFSSQHAGGIHSQVEDVIATGRQSHARSLCIRPVERCASRRGPVLEVERGYHRQLGFRITFQLGTDRDQRPILPRVLNLLVLFHPPPGYQRNGPPYGKLGQQNAAGQQLFDWNHRGRNRIRRRGGLPAPPVVAGPQAIYLDERALEAKTLHPLHALLEGLCLQDSSRARGGGEHFARRNHLRL